MELLIWWILAQLAGILFLVALDWWRTVSEIRKHGQYEANIEDWCPQGVCFHSSYRRGTNN